MTVISFINNKGGQSKSTSCATVGVLLARSGYRVLMVDTDNQCSLTGMMMAEPPQHTIAESFGDGVGYPATTIENNLDIVPSSIDMAVADSVLASKGDYTNTIANDLAPMAAHYDVALIDCAPSYGYLLNTIVASSDHCIICVQPEVLAMKGANTMADLCNQSGKTDGSTIGVLLTMVKHNNLHDTVSFLIRDKYKDMVFDTSISCAVAVATSPLKHQTIIDYSPKCKVSQEYAALTKEIVTRWLQ